MGFIFFLTFVGVLRAEAVELVEVCDAVGIRVTVYHKESVVLIVCCAILVVCVKTNGKVIRHSIQQLCTWFVPKVSVLIFLCTNWQRTTSLMYVDTLVVTLAVCPFLF